MPDALFSGGGELGELMAQVDWGRTSLGSAEHWPQSLRTCVRIILTSRQPMFVWWGDELINLYNDAYKSIVGGKHPRALGQPAKEVWQEIWDQVGPRAESAMRANEGTYDDSLLLIMERYGYREETYYTFSYSPVPNDHGGTGGIICANADNTQRIIGERQVALLRELASRTADARTWREACRLSALSLMENPRDICFALIYMLDDSREAMELAGVVRLPSGHKCAPQAIELGGKQVWPIEQAMRSHEIQLVHELGDLFSGLPSGAWDESPHTAAVVPLPASGAMGRPGVVVVGLNPYRLPDDSYSGFLKLMGGQVSASIANAEAYEQERRRAEALAELDRAKTIFFSNISHEFRTPLTLMLGPLEDILNDRDPAIPAGQLQQIETVHRNGLRLLRLVNTLLDFSRIEAGRIKALYRPVELCGRTAELGSVFRSAMERAGLKYKIDCKPLPEPVYIDADMWEKIVLNLLSNAFKFTLRGNGGDDTERLWMDMRSWRCGIRGSGFRRQSCLASSNAFIGLKGRWGGRTREPVSGWRWSMNWYGCTAERWRRRVCLARARPLRRGFRSGRPICHWTRFSGVTGRRRRIRWGLRRSYRRRCDGWPAARRMRNR